MVPSAFFLRGENNAREITATWWSFVRHVASVNENQRLLFFLHSAENSVETCGYTIMRREKWEVISMIDVSSRKVRSGFSICCNEQQTKQLQGDFIFLPGSQVERPSTVILKVLSSLESLRCFVTIGYIIKKKGWYTGLTEDFWITHSEKKEQKTQAKCRLS